MTDQDQPLPLFGFPDGKAAPEHGPDAEEWKQIGGDARTGDLFRPVSSGQRRARGVSGGYIREALTLIPPLFDIPER
jgi:hypothetical protein